MNLLKNPFMQILLLSLSLIVILLAFHYNYYILASSLCLISAIALGIYRYKKALEIVKESHNNIVVKQYKRLVVFDIILRISIIILMAIQSLVANSGLSYEIKDNIFKINIFVLISYMIIYLYYLSKRKSLFKKIYEQSGIDPNLERLEF